MYSIKINYTSKCFYFVYKLYTNFTLIIINDWWKKKLGAKSSMVQMSSF